MFVSGDDVEQIVHNQGGIIAIPRKIDNAVGVLNLKKPTKKCHLLNSVQTGLSSLSYPRFVSVGGVNQVRLVLGEVGEGGVVCGAVGGEGPVVEGVDHLGDVAPILEETHHGACALLYLACTRRGNCVLSIC